MALQRDLSNGPAQVTISPPSFKDEVSNDDIDLTDVAKPARTVTYRVIGHESEDPSKFVNLLTKNYESPNLESMTFAASPTNAYSTLQIVACFSYGNYAKLQNLCDYDNAHTLTNAKGICAKQFGLALDPNVR